MLRGGKWGPATVLEKAHQSSHILKIESGRTYRQNRSHIWKTKIDERDHVIEISDDNEEETSKENVTVQSDDTLKDMKQESEVK